MDRPKGRPLANPSTDHPCGPFGERSLPAPGWNRAEGKVDVLEHRSIIALSGLEGLSPPEVAASLGIPVGTVHSRLSRARAKLKELLDAE
jgi:hypothetical protein